jgi:DNA-binding protein Fis
MSSDREVKEQASTLAVAEAVSELVAKLIATSPGRAYRDLVALVDRAAFRQVLRHTGGNKLHAARLLGVNRNTLGKRCRALKISVPRPSPNDAARRRPQGT